MTEEKESLLKILSFMKKLEISDKWLKNLGRFTEKIPCTNKFL